MRERLTSFLQPGLDDQFVDSLRVDDVRETGRVEVARLGADGHLTEVNARLHSSESDITEPAVRKDAV